MQHYSLSGVGICFAVHALLLEILSEKTGYHLRINFILRSFKFNFFRHFSICDQNFTIFKELSNNACQKGTLTG